MVIKGGERREMPHGTKNNHGTRDRVDDVQTAVLRYSEEEGMDQGSVWGGFPCFLGFFLAHCFQQGVRRGEERYSVIIRVHALRLLTLA